MSYRRAPKAFTKRTGVRLGSVGFAAGLVGMGLVATGASAETGELTANCKYGDPAGTQPLTIQVDSNAPQQAQDGEDFPVTKFTGTVTLNEAAGNALADAGYTQMSGQTTIHMYTLADGEQPGDSDESTSDIPLTFENVEIPADGGEITFEVSASSPDSTAFGQNTDSLRFQLGPDLDLKATAGGDGADQDGDGQPDSSEVDCDFDASAQERVLDTVNIVNGSGGNNDGNNGGGQDDNANNNGGGQDNDGNNNGGGQNNNDDSDDDTNSDVPTVIDSGV